MKTGVTSLVMAAIGIFLIVRSKVLAGALLESNKVFWEKIGVKRFAGYGSFAFERWFLVVMGLFFLVGAVLNLKGLISLGE